MNDLILINKKHSLSEDYIPKDLVIVDENKNNFHGYNDPNMKPMVSKRVLINFLHLRKEALKSGFDIIIDSGYRSYQYQSELWYKFFKEYYNELIFLPDMDRFMVSYDKTNNRVAAAGHSEHQSGLAIDIACFRNGKYSDEIEGSLESMWMIDNAYKYGFILRYPEGKEHITGYNYEPWHYRYVGYPTSLEFYNGEYKTLEEYYDEKKLIL